MEARGDDWLTYPQRILFDRIGARNYVLETDAWGNFIITGYDYGSAWDWARFGLLHLWDGVWPTPDGGSDRILPEGWVDFVSTPAPGAEDLQYGGLFWTSTAAALCPGRRRTHTGRRDSWGSTRPSSRPMIS